MTSTPRTPAAPAPGEDRAVPKPRGAEAARPATVPEAGQAPGPDAELAAYLASHPSPAAAVDAVIRDERGRLLVVDPVYKAGWDLPGGMVDDEGLVDGLERELREELCPAGLRIGRLLAVDNVPATAYGRALTACVYAVHLPHPVAAEDLRLQRDELRAAEFVPEREALARLPERLRRRTAAALAAERGAATAHLADGHPAPLDERDRRALLPGPAVAAAALVTDRSGRILVVGRTGAETGTGADTGTETGTGTGTGTCTGRQEAEEGWERWVDGPGSGSPYRLPGTLVTAAETPEEGAARALARHAGEGGHTVGRLLAVDSARCPSGGRALVAHLFAARTAEEPRPSTARWLTPDEAVAAVPAHEARLLSAALAPGAPARASLLES
ncbi:NUDIX domain-containing protein [Streptomyces reniochalinae]|uniref:NUDIX hydrolase n=1 Tax=Streptomyces reniochalinae TaxID=2250578 RepID=A0A367EYM2_9ACTN|nr:NUDIX hydrolase [Streptomyces reniochalinae]RCG22270.1 NUDIX hydrolase [Streptomyces reniochalinae]